MLFRTPPPTSHANRSEPSSSSALTFSVKCCSSMSLKKRASRDSTLDEHPGSPRARLFALGRLRLLQEPDPGHRLLLDFLPNEKHLDLQRCIMQVSVAVAVSAPHLEP